MLDFQEFFVVERQKETESDSLHQNEAEVAVVLLAVALLAVEQDFVVAPDFVAVAHYLFFHVLWHIERYYLEDPLFAVGIHFEKNCRGQMLRRVHLSFAREFGVVRMWWTCEIPFFTAWILSLRSRMTMRH